jgi:O-antigen/teichoic acid export membrane protein
MKEGKMQILLLLVAIAMFVCFILVLIKLFKKEGVGLGILGIICGLYTFIWGWINHKKQKITNIMLIWSILAVIYLVLYYVVGVSLPSA